jgi:uncharacterized protein YrrD
MRMSHQALQKCTVQTALGEVLGKVSDTVYDCESFTIVQLVVTGGMLKSHLYHIHPHQIISITSTLITVQDTVERLAQDQTSSSRAPGTSAAMMREVE